MTITSYGYPGTVNKIGHAHITRMAGSEYNFAGPGDWKPTAVTVGADRSVSIATGMAFGRGVADVSDAPVTVQHDIVASGERWDMIVLNRDFTTKATTVVIVKGNSTKQLPTRLHSVTTGVDQQPLALVRIVAGQTIPQDVIDLRIHTSEGGALAYDTLTLGYLSRPGAAVQIGTAIWTYLADPTSGVMTWTKSMPTLNPVRLFPAGQPYSGPAIPAEGPFFMQGGTIVRTSDPQGLTRQDFFTAFPNGLLSITLTPSDDISNPGMISNLYGGDRAGFNYRLWSAYPSGMHILSGYLHRVNYIAIGY